LILDIRLPVRQSDEEEEDEGGRMGENEKFYRGRIKASSSNPFSSG